MKLYSIYQIAKADFTERTRRFSFLFMCAFFMFVAFFFVPNVDAPLVSICIEPNIFHQGSNSSWIPITIALCGGILFPMVGFSVVKNNINIDRNSGLLYCMQSMNMKRQYYVIGKFLSNLFLLTIMWLLVIISAAVITLLQFPNQEFNIYAFISPLVGMYPGIIFICVFAIVWESISFINHKIGNGVGLFILFTIFSINYSVGSNENFLLKIIDFSNYRWIMESINDVVVPVIGREVRETGILVPSGIFANSKGEQELIFRGLLWNSRYFVDKIIFITSSIISVIFAIILLETGERKKISFFHSQKKEKKVRTFYINQFLSEFNLILKDTPRWCIVFIIILWIYSFFAPLKYVQNYLWILMLIFSLPIFSQMGCKEYEHNLAEFFISIKNSFAIKIMYSYFWGVTILLFLSFSAIVKNFVLKDGLYVASYVAFSMFIPALACFLGEMFKSRKVFETIHLLFCFLILNVPSLLFQDGMLIFAGVSTIVLLFATFMKRLFL